VHKYPSCKITMASMCAVCVLRNYLWEVEISEFVTNKSKARSIQLYLELFSGGISMHTERGR
jgi:hypothetical protein